jgi:hypothetical protein
MHDLKPVDTLLKRLATFAGELEQLLLHAGVDWRQRPLPEQWSLTELVCHLRDVEREIHQPRFHALLAADNAFLSGVAADEWAESRRYQEQDGPAALLDFKLARSETARLLAGVPAGYWQRHGRHSFFGPTSAHELLALVVEHDHAHLQQANELLLILTSN